MAYFLIRVGKQEEAKMAVSAALDLEKPLTTFQANAFLLQLVTQSVIKLLAETREKRAKEPSLIVRP